ncbi:MAG: TonB-dependent receptor [Rhodospirillaceae bacterium]|nr:TonB-dependent receptor [Rhodospirillaceae bacterium]
MLKRVVVIGALAGTICGQGLAAEALPEILVTTRALKPSASEPAYNTTVLGGDALRFSAGARLDDVLRAVPGFGLFRRQSSRAAHPTTQGVTLRGLGPSGAGRTLVLLDGIPQNDAFGGWVDWSRIPTASLSEAAVTRGGGAGPWGNAALAGVVRLQSAGVDRDGGDLEFSAGPRDTFEGTASVQAAGDAFAVHGLVHGHRTAGAFLIREDQRGSIDRRAADEGGVVEAGARYALNDATVVRAVGRYSESTFINGIDIAESKTRVTDGALSVLHDTGGPTSWEANVYARDQAFRAVFAAVNATRTTATPSLDQFAVPATAVGGNVIVRTRIDDSLSLDAGGDIRSVEGDTNENFQNQGAGFTRVRRAGGEQLLAGAFTELNWQPTSVVLATVGGRVDAWRQSDGLRRESVLQTGAIVRDDRFAARDESVGTVRGALKYQATPKLNLKASGYTGFRLPTLNELYRPFRVGNDITEANPGLGIEKLVGFDFGFDWSASDAVQLSATYFHAVLKNAVTNVTVQTTPGLNAQLGVTVPAGGVLRQRRNIDRIAANGVEASAAAQFAPTLQASFSYLYTAPKVSRSPQQPSLEGLRLAQVPRHQATAGLRWAATERLLIAGQARGATKQFDDDQNQRTLRGYVVADATISFALTDKTQAFVSAENIFDRMVEAGRSADGIVSVATPRTARLGLRTRF